MKARALVIRNLLLSAFGVFGYLRYYTSRYDNSVFADAMTFIAENGGVVRQVDAREVIIRRVGTVKLTYGKFVALYLRHVDGGRGLVLLLRPFIAAVLYVALSGGGEEEAADAWRNDGGADGLAGMLRGLVRGRSLAELTRLPVAEAAMLLLAAVKERYGGNVVAGVKRFYGDPYDDIEQDWRRLPSLVRLMEYEKIVVGKGLPEVYREAAERLAAGEEPRKVQEWLCKATEKERTKCDWVYYEEYGYEKRCWTYDCDIKVKNVKGLAVIERDLKVLAVVETRKVA